MALRRFLLAAFLCGLAPSAFAHVQDSARLTPAAGWSWEPGVVIPLLLAGGLFALGARKRWGRPDWSSKEALSFCAGWLVLFGALVSPIHELGGQLFWVHMTQHELLMIVAAPLLVFSRPLMWWLWAMPQPWREAIGHFFGRRTTAAIWAAMTAPLFVWLLHGGTLWLWHIPILYNASVESEGVHALQHITFLSTALLFWWTLLHGRHGRLTYGSGVVYCFTTAVHTSVLGALMTFAPCIWYAIYDGRTAAFHLTPLQDQQIGGLIMWVPAGVVFTVLGLWLLAAWIRESERRVVYTRLGEMTGGSGA
jgi:putative membrane protein